MGQLAAHLVAGGIVELLQLVGAAPGRHPRNRHRPHLGEARAGRGNGVDQRLDVGGGQPQVGERVEALPGRDRLGEKDAVYSARRRAGDDVGQDAQADAGMALELVEQLMVHTLAADGGRGVVVARAAGGGEPPHLLGDAVHVHREADAAIADQRKAEFLLAHQRRISGDTPRRGVSPPMGDVRLTPPFPPPFPASPRSAGDPTRAGQRGSCGRPRPRRKTRARP